VQVDTLFIGNDPNAAQMTALLNFCVTTAMPQLLGVYGIGTGSLGVTDTIPYPGPVVHDAVNSTQLSSLQQIIAHEELVGNLPPQDGNQFIFVFVAPGIQVQTDGIDQPFLGYHWGMQSQGKTLPYAVIPYPQAPNALDPSVPIETSLEVTTTHELEEGLGNFTRSLPNGGELADLYNRLWFYDNGWHIQVAEGPQGQMLALGPIGVEPSHAQAPIVVQPAGPTDFFALAVEEFWVDTYTLLTYISPAFDNQLQISQATLHGNSAYNTPSSQIWLQAGDQLFYQVLAGAEQ
jgi:hypothetical protein